LAPRQGSNNQSLPAEKPELMDQATSDPTSSTNQSRNRRRKSTQRRSRTSPPASRPCPRRPSPPCRRSSAATPGDHDRCPAVTLPPVPPLLRIELASPSRMPMAGDYCAGQHDSGEPLSLRPRQAAAWLGVSVSTLNRLTRSGKIPRLTIGRIVLYRVETLRKWLENHET
jgi:excisionase family DNA binding protein